MCDKPNVFTPALPPVAEPPAASGSRRRRLWELPTQALCPVIGVCVPMGVLRRRLDKLLGGQALASDYELHCGAIQECGHRSPVAEILQRELELRHIRTIREAARHKTTLALGSWWAEAQRGPDVADSLWAVLTHARCDMSLQEQVLRDIHMLQHQVGAADRADRQKLDALAHENLVLGRELARVQQRSTTLLQQRAELIERQAAELVRRRAERLGLETLADALREQVQQLEAAVPGQVQRQARQIEAQEQRIAALTRALQAAQQQLEIERHRPEAPVTTTAVIEPPPAPTQPELSERSVLCVGGRQSAVPVYRALIERSGGRFLHHDGGEAEAPAKLDASLAAADLVICQTGCISHDAYWRVKDHCKRHGKRCLFVDKPSASSLQRALQAAALSESAARSDE